MKIVLDRINLLNKLAVLARALPTKVTLPILEGIYLEKQGGYLVLAANNLEIAIKTTVPIVSGSIDGSLSSLIMPKKFVEIVKQLPGNEIEMTIDGLHARLKSGRSNFRLNCIDAEGYPLFNDDYLNSTCFELDSESLKEMIRKTAFCAATDVVKHVFQGILMDNSDDRFICISSDTYRMSLYRKLPNIPNKPFKILVPRKSIDEISKIIKDSDIAKIYPGKQEIVFVIDEFVVQNRLLEGQFPNMEHIVPDSSKTIAGLNKQAFIDTLSRARLLTAGESELIELSLSHDSIKTIIRSEEGEMDEQLPAEVKGETLEQVMINAKFLMEGAKAFNCEKLVIEFNGDAGPVVIKDEGFCHLMLPIKRNY